MKLEDILFSVHTYDKDGDMEQDGIFLHFGEVRIRVADDLHGFTAVTERIASMAQEIADNYPEVA